MSDFILHNWVDVNQYMRDDYRLLVAAMAARTLKDAPPELLANGSLLTLARNAFSSIPVPGARSFFRADLIGQRKALAKAMRDNAQVAALVIALWANAAGAQIQLLKQAGEMVASGHAPGPSSVESDHLRAGLEFDAEWNWQKGMEGFFDFEDIPVLYALAEKLGEHASAQDADHLKLAALWLGPAVTNRDALGAPASEETTETQDEVSDSDAAEPV